MTQDTWDRAMITTAIVIAGSTGTLALLGVVLAVIEVAGEAAAAVTTAAPAGVGVSIAIRRAAR